MCRFDKRSAWSSCKSVVRKIMSTKMTAKIKNKKIKPNDCAAFLVWKNQNQNQVKIIKSAKQFFRVKLKQN